MKNNIKSLRLKKTSYSKQSEQLCLKLLPALIATCFVCGSVFANPTGGVATGPNGLAVLPGQVIITNTNANTLTITNNLPRAVITWDDFSIGAGQTTQFIQTAPNPAVLNRVGPNGPPSLIFGTLTGNGTIYLINPNNIVFGEQSQVNVGNFVASTLPMTDANFFAGNKPINQFGSGDTPNLKGEITIKQGARMETPSGGSIVLIAPDIKNSGILTSPNGQIILAAGYSVTLADTNIPNLHVVISSPSDSVTNLGSILAESGKIGIYGALIKLKDNQASGILNADKVVNGENGEIFLKSTKDLNLNGTVSVADGTLVLKSTEGSITQTNAINSTNLFADATLGNVTLTNANNTASNIAGQAGGSGGFLYTGSGNINVGTVNQVAGITSSSDIGLKATNDIALNAPVTAANGTVALKTSSGNITQSAGITAKNLSAVADNGFVLLAHSNNQVDVLGGSANNSGGFTFTNNKNFSVGAIPAVGPIAGINGVTTINAGTITLGAAGSTTTNISELTQMGPFSVANNPITLTVNGPIDAGSRLITLLAGDILQGTSDTAVIKTTGTLDLIAINGIGSPEKPLHTSVSFLLANNGILGAFDIGKNDITISNTDMPLTLVDVRNGGNIFIDANTKPLSVFKDLRSITKGDITLLAGSDITIFEGAKFSANNGNVTLKTTGGNIIQNSGITATGPITMLSEQGSITVNGLLKGSSSISLESQRGAILAGANGQITTPGALGLLANRGITAKTSVASITATNGTGLDGGGDISITNTGGAPLSIAGMTQINGATAGGIYVNSDGLITIDGAISNNNTHAGSDIGIKAAKGIDIYSPITANNHTVALMTSSNDITEISNSGYIVADAISANAASGSVQLINFRNAVNTVAGSASGDFTFVSDPDILVGNVQSVGSANMFIPAATGITSTTGEIGLASYSGNIQINEALHTSPNKIVGLNAGGGDITQTGNGIITTGSLSADALSSVSLGLENHVAQDGAPGILAGSSGYYVDDLSSFTFTNSNSFDIGVVESNVDAQLTGISAFGQPVTLTSTNGSIGTKSGSIIGSSLTVNAFSGVGTTASPLNTSVTNLLITNGRVGSGGGDIHVFNFESGYNIEQPLVISKVEQLNGGSIFIDTQDKALTVNGSVATGSGDIGLKGLGQIQINAPISASGTVALKSFGGSINEGTFEATTGSITANKLSAVSDTGDVTLTNPNNVVGTFAGIAPGTVLFNNSIAYVVGPVPGVGRDASGGFFIPAAVPAVIPIVPVIPVIPKVGPPDLNLDFVNGLKATKDSLLNSGDKNDTETSISCSS